MKVSELLAWLHMAALEQMSQRDIRDVLEEVLEEAPDHGGDDVERLLDAIEDQLDAEAIDTDALLAWPKLFAVLLPARPAPPVPVEKAPIMAAQEIPEEDVRSPRLTRFTSCLEGLALNGESKENLRALESLEQEIALAWDEYSAEPFDPETVSAEAAAGHRFLRDGFVCWFEAFHLAKARHHQQALSAAQEGTRLFRAVALWSDVAQTS